MTDILKDFAVTELTLDHSVSQNTLFFFFPHFSSVPVAGDIDQRDLGSVRTVVGSGGISSQLSSLFYFGDTLGSRATHQTQDQFSSIVAVSTQCYDQIKSLLLERESGGDDNLEVADISDDEVLDVAELEESVVGEGESGVDAEIVPFTNMEGEGDYEGLVRQGMRRRLVRRGMGGTPNVSGYDDGACESVFTSS
ncbi:uncharacterized protein [Palaemon carinicauda]|uniref:uncharacterized protein n=1 Tax=Palaemon carinicauda TaxID=392227 RepID=UPI0035B59E06